jgi:hypothetical protein
MEKWIRIGVLMVLAACGSTEPRALRVLVVADKTSVSVADSVVLSIQLVNRSSRVVLVPAPDSFGFCNHAFRVFNEQDRAVSIPTGFCLLIGLAPVELAPGASVTIRDVWHPAGSSIDGHQIPVGKYRIVGFLDGDWRDVRTASSIVTLFDTIGPAAH